MYVYLAGETRVLAHQFRDKRCLIERSANQAMGKAPMPVRDREARKLLQRSKARIRTRRRVWPLWSW